MLIDSTSSLQCFSLTFHEKSLREGLLTDLQLYIIRGGKTFTSRVIMKVAVIICLFVDPHIGTNFEPFKYFVLLFSGTYFLGVCSKFITNEVGMLFF